MYYGMYVSFGLLGSPDEGGCRARLQLLLEPAVFDIITGRP